MKFVLALILAIPLFVGCGTLIPKKVELLQDKVQQFPDKKDGEREIQREAAQRAARDSRVLVEQLVDIWAPSNVIDRAKSVAVITDAVSDSLGPPLSPNGDRAAKVADKLNTATAKFVERVFEFRKDNNENAGKKIEGTGVFQVSYGLWLGGFLFLGFLAYLALKVLTTLGAAANPVVGLGVNAVSMGAKGAAKALAQVLKGGKQFKSMVDQKIADAATRDEVLELFRVAQNEAQDEEVKQVVKHLVKE